MFGERFFPPRTPQFFSLVISPCANTQYASFAILMCFNGVQTRHTCASALCKIALRLPEPVRFDAYCFLKSLASSADVFSLVTPRSETLSNTDGVDNAAALKDYRGEQEALMERIERGESCYLSLLFAARFVICVRVFEDTRHGSLEISFSCQTSPCRNLEAKREGILPAV